MKTFKRLLRILLAVFMLISTVSVSAYDVQRPLTEITEVTAINPKVAVVKWSVLGEADGYEIQIKKPKDKFRTVKTITKKNRLWAKIKGLKPATKYKFRVRGYVQGSEKYYGKYSNKKVVVTMPSQVKIKSIAPKTAHSATLRWKKAKGADGYMILRKTKGKKGYSATLQVNSGKTKRAVLKGLKSKRKYFFKVVSYAKAGKAILWGKASDAVKITTPRRSATSMKFLPEFPRVPRLGFVAETVRLYQQEVEQSGHDFIFYYYSQKQVTQWERKWYVDTLKNYGFKFYEKWKNNDGTRVFSYTRKSTTVMITKNKNYLVVGVVRA